MTAVITQNTLTASFVSGTLLMPSGINLSDISIFQMHDDGAGSSPTDSPAGQWSLEVSPNGAAWYVFAEASSALASLAPSSSASAKSVVVRGVPGKFARLSYARTSGGGGNSRLTTVMQAV